MNEQLTVKNFGPIKDATVDFKRVTVFIGPTGGGKSTLAKLAAIFRNGALRTFGLKKRRDYFHNFSLNSFFKNSSHFIWTTDQDTFQISDDLSITDNKTYKDEEELELQKKEYLLKIIRDRRLDMKSIEEILIKNIEALSNPNKTKAHYITSHRVFIPAIEYSWAGILRDDIGLPKDILDFANQFSLSRKNVSELYIAFLDAKYIHQNGQDFIKVSDNEKLFRLYETASGIQAVTPMLVLLEHLSQQKEQAQSFIIEEPELNLYPTAQQGLMNWLVEKCTTGENDLTITTHSPYILASCNLLMEAYKVWQDRPELEAEIEMIVPRASWINPEEFTAYYVADGTVRSIKDERTDLIGGNELDAVSGEISDSFRSLLRLKKQPA